VRRRRWGEKKHTHEKKKALVNQDKKNHENHKIKKKKQDMGVVLTFECCSQAP
jgi:hypothetical protein